MKNKQQLENLAKNIRKYRAVCHFSQEELAEKANLTQQYICSLENARSNPTYLVLIRLAEALNVSLSDFAAQS